MYIPTWDYSMYVHTNMTYNRNTGKKFDNKAKFHSDSESEESKEFDWVSCDNKKGEKIGVGTKRFSYPQDYYMRFSSFSFIFISHIS